MNESLSNKVIRGSIWETASVLISVISNFISITILARLLEPEEFGVIAAIQIVTGIVTMFSDIGFSSAIIQRKSLTDEHIRVAYSSSVILGFLIFVSVWFLSPYYPMLINADINVWMIRVYTLSFPILSFSLVSQSLLKKKLQFKQLFYANLLATIFGTTGVGVVLGFLGFGPWSLVIASVSHSLALTIIYLMISKHPKKILFKKKEFISLFNFGGNYTILRLVNYFAQKSDNFLVGRFLGITALGFYDQAVRVMSMPGIYLGNVIDSVSFPTLAEIQEQEAKLRSSYIFALKIVSAFMMPLTVILVFFTPEIVKVLLGNQWLVIVSPLRILFLVISFRTSIRVSDSMARAKAALKENTNQKLIYLILLFFGVFLAKDSGLIGVAIGVNIAVICHFFLMVRLIIKLTNTNLKDILQSQRQGAINSFFCLLICFPVRLFASEFVLQPIISLSLIFIVVGFFILFFWFFIPEIYDHEFRYFIEKIIEILNVNSLFKKIKRYFIVYK